MEGHTQGHLKRNREDVLFRIPKTSYFRTRYREISMTVAHLSEIETKKTFILKEKRLDLLGTVTLFKNARLPKEIRNRFPEAGTISKKNMTYEEIRKLMILLFSYNFWSKVQAKEVENFFDDYLQEMNSYLFNSGLPDLYYGNPYDWMFLYCSLEDNPLDTFRNLLYEVLEL